MRAGGEQLPQALRLKRSHTLRSRPSDRFSTNAQVRTEVRLSREPPWVNGVGSGSMGASGSIPMIGWLQGDRIDTWAQGTRRGWLIACAGVGYEVQLTERHMADSEQQRQVTLWIHQVQKEDGSSLFGFPERRERDLFRQLISVNGVGPQVGMALLACWCADELVNAILDGDVRRLCQAQGVGKRTAERLAVELRDRLAAGRHRVDAPLSLVDRQDLQALPIAADPLQDLQLTLTSLGYEDLEIRRALRAVASSAASGSSPAPRRERERDE